jgi:hypothetical protein
MNLTKVSRNDWIVVGGFVLAFIGTLGPWYGVHATTVLGQIGGFLNGWHGSFLGWLVFLLCLAAAVLALSKAFNITLPLPLPAPLLIMTCGALSVLLVFIRLVIGFYGFGRGWGIWITLIAAIIVALGGLLKNSEPAS